MSYQEMVSSSSGVDGLSYLILRRLLRAEAHNRSKTSRGFRKFPRDSRPVSYHLSKIAEVVTGCSAHKCQTGRSHASHACDITADVRVEKLELRIALVVCGGAADPDPAREEPLHNINTDCSALDGCSKFIHQFHCVKQGSAWLRIRDGGDPHLCRCRRRAYRDGCAGACGVTSGIR